MKKSLIYSNIRNNLKTRLCALSLASLLMIAPLTGCSSTVYRKTEYEVKTKFATGHHALSIPIENPVNDNVQYAYHKGYKPVGISLSASGESNSFSHGYLLFVNDEDVICVASGVDDKGNYAYLDFGSPENVKDEYINETSETKDFDIGEHILSIPFDFSNINGNFQYPYYEGYEVVDIATVSDSRGCILFVNVVPVRCEVDSYGKTDTKNYTKFGRPLQKDKEK